MFCGLCKKECDAVDVDDSFDYEGPLGTQTEQASHLESVCCGNPVFYDEECTMEVSPEEFAQLSIESFYD